MQTAPATAEITRITLIGTKAPKGGTRLVKIDFSDGETVSVAGTYGGYEQYGALRDYYAITQPIAQRYVKWLNGGHQPKPLARFVTIEQGQQELTAPAPFIHPVYRSGIVQTNFDNINTFTGFAEGEPFTSEQQVRDYFTPENMRRLFGADPNYPMPARLQLIEWADAVINTGWHCAFKA